MAVKVREKVEGTGVYWVFIDDKGRRYSESVGRKVNAENLAKKYEAQITLGTFWSEIDAEKAQQKAATPGKMTVQEFYDKEFKPNYIDNAGRCKPGSRNSIQWNLTAHVLPFCNARKLTLDTVAGSVPAFFLELS